MFTIIIPSYNNLDYLKICIKSLFRNSFFKNQIIVHLNIGTDGSKEYLKINNIDYTHTSYNAGICEGVNKASKKSIFDYIVYGHDDFYYCPNWDIELYKEIKLINHNKFYLSGSMISNYGHNGLDCGNKAENFDEQKILNNYNKISLNDHQGSTWAPHVVHKDYWNLVGGFSEEFFPGAGSDPDFCMKLWNNGIRIFKGISKSRVYHFESKTLRREKLSIGSKSSKLFLFKWGITINFFKNFYLKSGTIYNGILNEPIIDIKYAIEMTKCKFFLLYIMIINIFDNKITKK
jgi:glycosyltransferase involved in cell wall biosynthesis